ATLKQLLADGTLKARASYGFFPAAAVGDDIELYADESRSGLLGTLHTLRQQAQKSDGLPAQALSDFVAPRESGLADWIGAFAVTAGLGVDELVARHDRENDPYAAIMVKALADRLAEALAEWLHQRARREWGYGKDEAIEVGELIREKYRGIRPAPTTPRSGCSSTCWAASRSSRSSSPRAWRCSRRRRSAVSTSRIPRPA